MNEGNITIVSNNYCYGAVVYIDPETWENGKKKYRWDIVKQKSGKIIDTIEINYARSVGQAVAKAIYAIKKRRDLCNKKERIKK